MSRYIDADALKNKITELDDGCAVDGIGFDIYTCEVFELIDEVPTANVHENVKGEWKRTPTGQPYCSVCGDFPWEHGSSTRSYCSECGAYMEQN